MVPKFLTVLATSAILLTPAVARAEWQPVAHSRAGTVYVDDTSIVRMGKYIHFLVNSQPNDGSPRMVAQFTASCRSNVYFFAPINEFDGTVGLSDATHIAATGSPIAKSIQYVCNKP